MSNDVNCSECAIYRVLFIKSTRDKSRTLNDKKRPPLQAASFWFSRWTANLFLSNKVHVRKVVKNLYDPRRKLEAPRRDADDVRLAGIDILKLIKAE